MYPQDILPSSPDSEKALLSSLLLSPAKTLDLCSQQSLDDSWFSREDNGRIFNAVAKMQKEGRPIDLITASDYFVNHYKEISLDTPNIHATLAEIFSFVPTASNAPYYLQILQEKYASRLGIMAAMSVQKELRAASTLDDIHTITSKAFVKCHEVCVVQQEDKNYDQNAMMGFLDRMEASATGTHKPEFFPTSFPTIDNECGGLTRGELLLIRGRKGTGKSLLSQAILQNNIFSSRKTKAAIYTFEMPYDQYMRRLVASHGKVSLNSMRHGRYTEGELKGFNRSMSALMSTNLRIYDTERLRSRPTPEVIFSSIRKLVKNEGLDLAAIDHLHLIKFKEAKGKNSDKRADEQLHDFSAEFKSLCLELKIAGILLAQENADGGTFGGTQVETDVDTSLSLTAVTKMINGIKRIVGTDGAFCDKCRDGDLLGKKIPLVMNGKYATISEGEELADEAAF